MRVVEKVEEDVGSKRYVVGCGAIGLAPSVILAGEAGYEYSSHRKVRQVKSSIFIINSRFW
jgi:hypothetical protein